MIDRVQSDSITCARVLCIFSVMFVHVYSGYPHPWPVFGAFEGRDVLFHFFTDVLGRSSVPLLTIISGWLLARQNGQGYPALLRIKLKTLVVPMILWSAALLVLIALHAAVTGRNTGLPGTALGWVNAVASITQAPVNGPLAFLRDLFVVFLISPVLLPLVRRLGIWLLLVLFCGTELFPSSPFLLRSQILLFFSIGVYLSNIDVVRIRYPVVVGAFAFVMLTFAYDLARLSEGLPAAGYFGKASLFRISVAILIWSVCGAIARVPIRWVQRLEPYCFMAFCSHVLTFEVLSVPGRMVFGRADSPAYPIYFLLQPVLAFVAAIALTELLSVISPTTLRILNANRLPRTLLRQQGLPWRRRAPQMERR